MGITRGSETNVAGGARSATRAMAPRAPLSATSVLAAMVALTAVASPILAGSATAAPAPDADAASAEDVLVVTQALSAELDIGDDGVLRVEIAADRLIDGDLVVGSAFSDVVVRRPVQVSGGSTEQVLLVVPVADPTAGELTVELVDDTGRIDVDEVRFSHDASTDVAAVLPVLATRAGEPPRRVTLLGDLRRVNMVTVDPELFAIGPRALSGIDTVLGTSDDLSALGPEGLANLLTWIAGGGTLVLDDADDLSSLPPDWRPGEAMYAAAGTGSVRIHPGRLTAGDWDVVIPPSPLTGYDSPLGQVGADMVSDPRSSLARRAGISLPDLGAIIVVLGIYVVVIGPILYLVLRRMRRLTAAWVVIPALAVLVAAGVVVTSRSWNTSGRPAASAVVHTGAGGSVSAVQHLVLQRSGGTSSVAFPSGWTALTNTPYMWFSGSDVSRTALDGADGLSVEASLEPGQVAVFEAAGPVGGSLLEVTASVASDGSVRGEVTNLAAVDLRSIAVFAGGAAVLVGDVPAGGSAPYVLERVSASPDPFDTPIRQVYDDPEVGFGFDTEKTPFVDLGLWSWFAGRSPDAVFPSGHVRAVAWSDELDADDLEPTADSNDVTMLTTTAAITAPDGVRAISVRHDWVQSAFDPQTGALDQPVVRYQLPPGEVTGADFEVDLGSSFTAAEFLTEDGTWRKRTPADGSDVVAVPADAVRNGIVVVRLTVDLDGFVDPSTISAPELSEVGS